MSHQPNNIFAGTQVVALVEVRGTNNSLVHPRGAVGVVTRTPAGAEKHFLVRFPDGFEATFTIDQIDILKHFKERFESPKRPAGLPLPEGKGRLARHSLGDGGGEGEGTDRMSQ